MHSTKLAVSKQRLINGVTMFEGFFGRCDKLKAAARLVPAYINMAGFDTDTLSDDTDGGDWLGLGDPVKVAEIKRFNKRDNTFNFFL